MEGEEMTIPPFFRCPISLDLFKDPVTLSTGQTYDRSFIEKWLSDGNSTCPVTMQKLEDSSMVPNHTLRHLIEDWLSFSCDFEPIFFESKGAGFSVAAAKQLLVADESTWEDKLQVLEKVYSLSQELPLKNYFLIKMDFFELVLDLALRLDLEKNVRVVEEALSCAVKLMPFSDLSALNMLREESKYQAFLSLFEKGNLVIKKCLCYVVEAIPSCSQTKQLCANLARSVKLVQEVVILVSNNDASDVGIRALSALASIDLILETLAREGAVKGLVDYISNTDNHPRKNLTSMAMSTMVRLLGVDNAKESVIGHPNGVKAIVKMVFRVSNHGGSESAVDSLTVLCSWSRIARERAVFEGVLTQLLLLIQSQCSGKTKSKARMLLKMIRSMWIGDMHHAL